MQTADRTPLQAPRLRQCTACLYAELHHMRFCIQFSGKNLWEPDGPGGIRPRIVVHISQIQSKILSNRSKNQPCWPMPDILAQILLY